MSRWTRLKGQKMQTKGIWVTGWVTASMRQTIAWPQMSLVAGNISRVFKWSELSLCKHYPLGNRTSTCVTWFPALWNTFHSRMFVPHIDLLTLWLLMAAMFFACVQVLFIMFNCYSFFLKLCVFVCFVLQEEQQLLHRQNDIHGTEDRRGITQRSKRSPSKQSDSGRLMSAVYIWTSIRFR